MESLWQVYKQGFTAWEQATAKLLETVLKSPSFLEPAGQALSMFMRNKTQLDAQTAQLWASLGLPTRRDQERTLHLLNQLQSRLIDLEERLMELRDAHRAAPGADNAPGNRGQRTTDEPGAS